MSKLYRAGKSLFRYFVPAGNRMCVVPDEKILFPSDMEYLGIPIPVIAEKYRQVIEEVLEAAQRDAGHTDVKEATPAGDTFYMFF